MKLARRKLWTARLSILAGLALGLWLAYEPGEIRLQGVADALLLMPLVLMVALLLVTGRVRASAPDPMQAHMSEAAIQAELARYPPVVRAALLALRERSGGRTDLRPLLHRLLWRRGVKAPPFDFGHVGWNLALIGGAMFVSMPLWFYLHVWAVALTDPAGDTHMTLVAAHVLSFVLGVIALAIVAYMRSEAKRQGLPSWAEFQLRFAETADAGAGPDAPR